MGSNKDIMKSQLNIITITWPIFAETLLRMLLGNVDTFMLGHYSKNAVAGVGVANQINGMVMLIYAVTATGTAITIAQYLGAKQREKAIETAGTALVINLIFGLVMSVILVSFAAPILRLMDVPEEAIGYGVTFLRIIGFASFFQALLSTTSAIIRSFGKTKVTMYVAMAMNVTNVIGNCLFLYGFFGIPVLGVTGVAISTAVSQAAAFLMVFFVIMKKIGIRPTLKSVIPFRKDISGRVLSIGLPSAGENMAYQFSQLVITRIITGMGTDALATRVYTMNILWFVMLSGISLGQGTQILVGHQVGAGRYEKAYNTCMKSLRTSIVIALMVSTLIAVLGKNVVGLLTDDGAIISMASKLLWLSIILEVGRVFNLVIINSLKAAGDVILPVAIGAATTWFTAVLLSYVLGIVMGWGLIGVWIGFMTDEWLRGIIMLLRWKSRVWQSKRVIRTEKIESAV